MEREGELIHGIHRQESFDPSAPSPFRLGDIGAAVPKHCLIKNYHGTFGQDVDELRRQVTALNSRKEAIQRMLKVKVCPGIVVSKQVQDWLEDLQRIYDEIQDIEEKVSRLSFFSRAFLGKLVRNKIEEVEKIHQRKFREGVVIDVRPPTIGTDWPTVRLLISTACAVTNNSNEEIDYYQTDEDPYII